MMLDSNKIRCNEIGSKASAGGPSDNKRARKEEEEKEVEERKEQAAREAASQKKKEELAKKRAEKTAKNKGRKTRTKTGVSRFLSGKNCNGKSYICRVRCDQDRQDSRAVCVQQTLPH